MFNINSVTVSFFEEFSIPERPIGTHYFYDQPKIRIVNETSNADISKSFDFSVLFRLKTL